MRSISASLMIPRSIDSVWAALSRPEGLQAVSEAFAGWGARFNYSVDNGAALGHGAQLVVTNPRGRPMLRWKVSVWEPPKALELVADEPERFVAPFHMMATFKLSDADADLTEVHMSVVLIFLSRWLEVASLLLPVRFLYVRRLKRALARLKASLAS